MRRTLIEEPQKEHRAKQLKPVYGAINALEGPYYDPYDIHIHQWINGPLKFPQNHREPVYDNIYPDESGSLKEYCSICHEINCVPERSLKHDIRTDSYDISQNVILNYIDNKNYNDFSKRLSYENGYVPNEYIPNVGNVVIDVINKDISIFDKETEYINDDEFVVVLMDS
jgi:hypothetical protein